MKNCTIRIGPNKYRLRLNGNWLISTSNVAFLIYYQWKWVSIFIITATYHHYSDIIIERHWRGIISRSIGYKFWEEVKKSEKPEDVLPVIAYSKYYLIHVYRDGIFFLGVVCILIVVLIVFATDIARSPTNACY